MATELDNKAAYQAWVSDRAQRRKALAEKIRDKVLAGRQATPASSSEAYERWKVAAEEFDERNPELGYLRVAGQALKMNDTDIALLLLIADSLERQRQTGSAGVIRRAARRLAELPVDPPDDGCARCGRRIVQKSAGRPRRYCSESCRRRKLVGNASLLVREDPRPAPKRLAQRREAS